MAILRSRMFELGRCLAVRLFGCRVLRSSLVYVVCLTDHPKNLRCSTIDPQKRLSLKT
jgi:hypothetical protein